jgi:AbrB family looped-hinge helix DNA binding protein
MNAICKWFKPFYNGIVPTKLTVDKAGRIVLPKPLREKLQLVAGTLLQMENEGENITLRPVRPKATLAKEFGIWVYQGGPSDDSIPDLIDRVREERLREFF